CIHPLGRCSHKTRQVKLLWDVVMHWIYSEVWLTTKPFLCVNIENFSFARIATSGREQGTGE
ncbi:MAG: hypothetical protein VKL60_17060, partial [Sphaerospermopsis sp.]|nr:hypothetical protein [Sphaerospermopsis sp.]